MALPNPSAFYNFDESSGNAADATGNGYTLTNNNTVGYTAGLINNCADFGSSNTNKYFNSTATLGDTGGSLYFSLWFNLSTALNTNETTSMFYIRSATSQVFYILNYYNASGTDRIRFERFKPGVGTNVVERSGTISTGGWHHIVAGFNSSTNELYLYYDNSLVTSASASGSGSGVSNLVEVGFGNGYLKGKLDAFGVFPSVLSTTDISDLYNSGNGLQYPFPSNLANLKTLDGIAKANIKTIDGIAIANVKTYNGIA